MAIPKWTWPDGSGGEATAGASEALLEGSDVEAATDVFELLSNRSRLEILASLHGRTEPVSYTELRESTSVEDKGRFNYHLRRLDGFVRNEDGAYALTPGGEALVRDVVAEERIRTQS